MNQTPIHSPRSGVLKVVALMSGSGTNLLRVLEHEQKLAQERGAAPFHICAIFTDNPASKAEEIGRRFQLPVITRDIKAFYKNRNLPRKDMNARKDFDRETLGLLKSFNADLALYAGYMSITTEVLVNAYTGINVHPADLSVMEEGKRKWTGGHCVRDAILAGEKIIRSTVHIIEPVVDGGRILMISRGIEVELPGGADLKDKELLARVTDHNQNRLKEAGDWVIMPKTLEYIADGFYSRDEKGDLYFKGEPIPGGLRLED